MVIVGNRIAFFHHYREKNPLRRPPLMGRNDMFETRDFFYRIFSVVCFMDYTILILKGSISVLILSSFLRKKNFIGRIQVRTAFPLTVYCTMLK